VKLRCDKILVEYYPWFEMVQFSIKLSLPWEDKRIYNHVLSYSEIPDFFVNIHFLDFKLSILKFAMF